MDDNIIDKTCINILNDDCIIEIFLLLPIADRIRSERVCKRWRSLGKQSWKEVRILDVKKSTWGLPEESNNYNLDIVKHVLTRCGKFLKQLNVLQWPLNSDHKPMSVICEYCPNLQCINLMGIDKFWLSTSDIRSLRNNYQNLSKLIMTDVKLECEDHLSQLFRATKKLKYLSVGGLVGHTDLSGKCLQYLPGDAIEEIHLIRWGNLNPNYLNAALRKFNNLRVLEMFPFNRFDNSTLGIIGEKRTIIDLSLFNTPGRVISSINYLFNLQNLERLCLRRNSMINDIFLINISNNLKQLKYLNISSCKEVTDVGISNLASLEKLEVLIANRLDKITNEPFGNFYNLKVLKCARCENIIDPGIMKLISLAPNLTTLDLFRCSITNQTIEKAIEITKQRTNSIILEINIHKTKVDMSMIPDTSPYLRIVDTRPTDYYYYEV
ncbi:hypothetical protein PV327_010743 [Microctonus hyperodae]|uniref:F-box domain-containing protein n=1 Tax=Microctonus hyperodae TaxID=165561 RepID=A0AA39C8P9_MICHY|nr:hypothetical protein PV327_010743 [Microctonus hyperodae]